MERYNLPCVVNIRHRDGSLLGTCCGILVDSQSGLVLAHASCLASCLDQDEDGSYLDERHLKSLRHLHCEILLEQIHNFENEPVRRKENDLTLSSVALSNMQQLQSGLAEGKSVEGSGRVETKHTHGVENLHQLLGDFYAHSRFSATLCAVFQCPPLAESLDTLMSQSTWELVDRNLGKPGIADKSRIKNDDDRNLCSGDLSRSILSRFVLFRIHRWTPYFTDVKIRETSQCCIGDKTEIISTPFGGLKPDIFMNSVSRGVVSNIAGSKGCLLLTDARCIWGGEGSPLYTFNTDDSGSQARFLTAVIISSLCWKNEEWVGFCLACDVAAILHSIPPHLFHFHNGLADLISTSTSSVQITKGSFTQSVEVVLVKMGPTWGSGVVINRQPTVILTCSHVIKESYRYPVQIKKSGEQDLETVKVVHQQLPLRYPFDLAVLWQPGVRADSECRPTVSVPREGMEVLVIGHALFDPELNLHPSVTMGVISKVICVNKLPVMIQTTCAVHPGASGGALVDTRGHLIGIVVCNARDTSTSASFPHVNMSIPLCTVWPLIEKFLDKQETHQLKALTIRNKTVNAIWSLEPVTVSGDKNRRSKL